LAETARQGQRLVPGERRVVTTEPGLLCKPHLTQSLRDDMFTRRQNSTDDQHLDMSPDWCSESGAV